MNAIRPGLLAYGLHPSGGTAAAVDVTPIMGVEVAGGAVGAAVARKGRVDQLRDARSSPSAVGDRRTWYPVGYGHGYPFHSLRQGRMWCSVCACPSCGRVTMDMTMIDLTDVLKRRPSPAMSRSGGRAGDVSRSPSTTSPRGAALPSLRSDVGISKRVPRTYFRRGKVETFKSFWKSFPTTSRCSSASGLI